jgi:hypothetical protein
MEAKIVNNYKTIFLIFAGAAARGAIFLFITLPPEYLLL